MPCRAFGWLAAAQSAVNPNTIAKAFTQLVRDGVLESQARLRILRGPAT